MSDPEAGAQFLHGPQAEKVFANDAQDEEKAVGAVGDQVICQDGMGASAAPAADPGDADFFVNRAPIAEVYNDAYITGKADTAAAAPTEGTGLHFRPEGS